MNKNFKVQAQGGFTLIELIVVIVILGILAATALPKFAGMGGDARLSSLNAVRGSLNSVAVMAHGRFLANTGATPVSTVRMEDVTVNLNTTSGYPVAALETAQAAGVQDGTDYRVYTATAAGTPTVPANSIAIGPLSLVGTANAANCYVTYTAPTAANTVPTITVTGTADTCN
jgi:MSHA pilin protein MshA